MTKLNALIAGSTGYIGIQLVKCLIKHKNIKIKYLCGNSSVGKKLSYYEKLSTFKRLPKIIKFDNKLLKDVDLVFTALPNGEAQKISKHLLDKNTLIDLAADFRLEDPKEFKKWYKIKHKVPKKIPDSIYAIPEISGNKIKKFNIIACPGCYPTSILLPLIPLIKKNIINTNNIVIDSKSGYSGAGRGVYKKFKNKNLYESLSAYGLDHHRHNAEIDQELKRYTKSKIDFIFTPHITPMFRGILSTIYVDLKNDQTIMKVLRSLKKIYRNHNFVKILKINTALSTNNVINTNNCFISVCKTRNKKRIIILSAIDNLIKGGAGQAVQNMNIKYGYNINEGLK